MSDREFGGTDDLSLPKGKLSHPLSQLRTTSHKSSSTMDNKHPSRSPMSPHRFKNEVKPNFERDSSLIPFLSHASLRPLPPKRLPPQPSAPPSTVAAGLLPRVKKSSNSQLTLPKATVQKIISEILATPSLPHASSTGDGNITFARDARELLIECCVEFITLISSEANEIAEKEQKKTIAIEHIDRALKDLGFPEYVKEVLASAGDAKELLKVRLAPPFPQFNQNHIIECGAN